MNNENIADKYLLIVNRNETVDEEMIESFKEHFEYVPYTDEDGESQMELETFKAYNSLVKLMKEKHNLTIWSRSAWRSIETQKSIYLQSTKAWGEAWTQKHVALPGESEHHTGLAFDIKIIKYPHTPDKFQSIADKINGKLGIKKKFYDLIEKEAVQFGLIKRYQKGKEETTGFDEENWHFRYVGVEHAKKIYESGMCLEEYVRLLESQKENSKVKVH